MLAEGPPVTRRSNSQKEDPEARRFGRYIRSLRCARGLTQEALAERSNLAADTIRRLEYGTFSPTHDALRKLCQGLNVRLSTLFQGFENATRDVPREILDVLEMMGPREQDLLLRHVDGLSALFRRTPCEDC